ncbi:MAG: phosphate transport system regulatory protein PhoU [Deltaproteobacteria bacterium]|nr:phosphate transport system regulatory protein PhoU [Deltaproteobacteria bacterium]
MTIHFQRELEKIKKRILSLGAMVEERVRLVIRALETRDGDAAKKIIISDHEIDEMEVEIEEECLKILALYQPVAIDLRFLTAVIKINNDLERVADEAVNIAERVKVIARRQRLDIPFNHSSMAEKSEFMLKDNMMNEAYDVVKHAIGEHPDRVSYLINLLLVSRHLERIADHATNIAEEVIYLVEGEIVRHGNYL